MPAGNKALELTRKAAKLIIDSKGFNRYLQKVEILDATPGTVKARYTVTQDDVNIYGTLHGGWTANMVDIVTTLATANTEPVVWGVSIDLSVSYMKAAKLGETITMEAVALKKGSKLCFSTIDFRNASGQLIAQGKHTKFLDVQK